jgi:hypothetical protein
LKVPFAAWLTGGEHTASGFPFQAVVHTESSDRSVRFHARNRRPVIKMTIVLVENCRRLCRLPPRNPIAAIIKVSQPFIAAAQIVTATAGFHPTPMRESQKSLFLGIQTHLCRAPDIRRIPITTWNRL